jgi:hypothetical protein
MKTSPFAACSHSDAGSCSTGASSERTDGDGMIRRLIAGQDIDDLIVYDVSDCQLYGQKRFRRLTGEFAAAAEANACMPEVYQSVYWFTLAYMPLKPLGVFLALPRQSCDDPDGDALQYRVLRLPTDRLQIALPYAVGVLILAASGALLRFLVLASH